VLLSNPALFRKN